MTIRLTALCFACCALFAVPVDAQEADENAPADTTEQTEDENTTAGTTEQAEEKSTTESVKEQAEEVVEEGKEKIDEIAKEVDESEQAQDISAGILQPIYKVAEQLAFRSFHWIAFAIMTAGVVSYALQLVLTKLVLLLRASLSLAEVFSDALGLIISVVGLVLTTQAATENSEFTRSPFLVISAAGVGLIVGFIFYRWGHNQETQALKGRRVERMGAK